jgi:hypothetical protein
MVSRQVWRPGLEWLRGWRLADEVAFEAADRFALSVTSFARLGDVAWGADRGGLC